MNPYLRRPRTVALWGALTLWVIFPIVAGGFVLVAQKIVASNHQSVVTMMLMALWAIFALILLFLGFAWILIAVFTWWREHQGKPVMRYEASPERRRERAEVLADVVRSRRRDADDASGNDASDGSASSSVGGSSDAASNGSFHGSSASDRQRVPGEGETVVIKRTGPAQIDFGDSSRNALDA